MVVGPCGRCARPVVARVAPGAGCRRGALDNEERGRAISAEATADTEQSEGAPIRRVGDNIHDSLQSSTSRIPRRCPSPTRAMEKLLFGSMAVYDYAKVLGKTWRRSLAAFFVGVGHNDRCHGGHKRPGQCRSGGSPAPS